MAENEAFPVYPGWETVRLIGRGSFGAVYEIEREMNGYVEKAALKYIRIPQNDSDLDELRNDGYDEKSITERFEGYLHDILREYSMMVSLKGCSNVVYCDDVRYVQHDNGIGWDILIKMELLSSLPRALGTDVSDEQVLRIGTDMCSALIFCEKRNLIHRDIKPANIFVAPDGTCKLGDFGIAKTAERTTSGTKTGTYKYMAPEVYNNQPYGAKADIYSLGLVLYWLLNERRTPFLPLPPRTPTSREEDEARLRRFKGESIPAPANGSPALQRIVLKACAFDPKDRYHSAEDMLHALEALGTERARPMAPLAAAGVVPVIAQEAEAADEITVGTQGARLVVSRGPESAERAVPAPQEPDRTVGVFSRSPEKERAARNGAEAPEPAPEKPSSEDATVSAAREAKKEEEKPPEKKKKKKALLFIPLAAVLGVAALLVLLFRPRYGEWTAWSPVEPAQVEGRRVEESTEYRSREQVLCKTADAQKVVGAVENEEYNWTDWSAWGGWQEEQLSPLSQQDYERDVEVKTEYRYRDKETTTSSERSMNGWTLVDSQTLWSDYGDWSSWSTTAVSRSDSREVETKTQYRSRSIYYESSSTPINRSGYELISTDVSYGSWSSWSTTPVSASSTRDVQTQTVQIGTRYRMGHYCTGNVEGARYLTWPTNQSSNEIFNKHCVYHELGSFDSLSSFTQQDGGYRGERCSNTCYLWYIMSTQGVYETQYRYRSIQYTYRYRYYGDWSSWTDGSQSGSSSKEVQTRTMYRYRDRTSSERNTFTRWSEFSQWSESPAQETSTREVQTRQLYRAKERKRTTVYYYYDWGEWSDWAQEPIEAGDERQVETRTVYRYADRE